MSLSAILMWAGLALTGAILAGLALRRRFGLCWTFGPYLAVPAIGDILMIQWPDQFHTQWFWLANQVLIALLRFALALELTYRTVRAFPTARATVRAVLLGVLMLTCGMVFSGVGDLTPAEGAPILGPVITRVQPLVLYGSVWLLTGIAAVILWYRLPVHPLHKAILVGLVPYLLLFNLSLNLIEKWGWNVPDIVIGFPAYAWLSLLGFWATVAWRPGDLPVRAPEPDPAFRRATS